MRLHHLAATCAVAALVCACGAKRPLVVDGTTDASVIGVPGNGDGAQGGQAGQGGQGGDGVGGAGGDGLPDCPSAIESGQPCSPGPLCLNFRCETCSERYWHRLRGLPCTCGPTGVWTCPSVPGMSSDCFWEPPLDCAIAASLYEDATCQTHPACGPDS